MNGENPELLFLHALPLDGSMWAAQMGLLPGRAYAPTLYGFGDHIEAWAEEALKLTKGNRLIVVGCSVGGSCALEVAALAPERVAALVLIGTKGFRREDSDFRMSALQMLREEGLETAWNTWWGPAFSHSTSPKIIDVGKTIAMRQTIDDVICGVTVFHTRPSRQDVLSTFSGPIVVVTGADDKLPGPTTSAKQAEMALNGHLHVIPDCGHYVPIEQPEVLNSIIRKLIQQTVSGPFSPL